MCALAPPYVRCLQAPKLEALLFAVTTGTFVLINVFLSDLADPFGGSWNQDAARAELSGLLRQLEQEVRSGSESA